MVHYSIIFIWICFLRLMETNSRSIPENIKVQNVSVIQNNESFLENHSALSVIPLQNQSKSSPLWALRYMLGIKAENDYLLAQLADASDYPAKKNVSVDLLYTEKGGTGDILTYIEIDTLQDTQDGNAHVVSGGIGQGSIHIVLEAKQTERFSYNARFYGRKTLKLMT
uniref:Cadherin domain-containing protein n=1 Tax=Glossina pallidipes TaxID=7398 RepID=A0A1A9ZTN0_GLOPL